MSNPAPQSAFEEVPSARVIACRHEGDYVQFTLREWKGGGTVSVSGSYDAMSTHAFSYGDRTLGQFLAGCSMDYMMQKLTGGKLYEPDWEKSCEELRKELLRRRREDGLDADREYALRTASFRHITHYGRDKLLTKELAREQYDDFFTRGWEGDEEKFRRIVIDGSTAAFGEECYEFQRNRVRGWIPFFWTNFWLPFLEYLNANPTVVPEEKSE